MARTAAVAWGVLLLFLLAPLWLPAVGLVRLLSKLQRRQQGGTLYVALYTDPPDTVRSGDGYSCAGPPGVIQ